MSKGPRSKLGNENSAQNFSDRSFWKSLWGHDVREGFMHPLLSKLEGANFVYILSAVCTNFMNKIFQILPQNRLGLVFFGGFFASRTRSCHSLVTFPPRLSPAQTPQKLTSPVKQFPNYSSQYQKNPRVRKIFVRNSGAGNGCANFMDAWKNASVLQENPPCP